MNLRHRLGYYTINAIQTVQLVWFFVFIVLYKTFFLIVKVIAYDGLLVGLRVVPV